VRNRDDSYFLVETKGREDRDVPLKVKAAVEWCKSASKQKIKWEYLYVPQGIFSRFSGNAIADLARTCAPSLSDLLSETVTPQLDMFSEHVDGEEVKVDEFIDQTIYETLPSRYKKAIEQAILLFDFHRNKQIESFSPIFQPLSGPLDDAAKAFIISKLSPDLPETEFAQKDFFNPYYGSLSGRDIEWHRKHTDNLRRTLVYQNGLWPLGLLKFCLDYSENDQYNIAGVFESIKKHFKKYNGSGLLDSVNIVADFRNKFVAHQEEPLTDVNLTKNGLKAWIRGLVKIYQLRQE
jgi:type III restriction enzyme